jgi:hypothetical protein
MMLVGAVQALSITARHFEFLARSADPGMIEGDGSIPGRAINALKKPLFFLCLGLSRKLPFFK